VRPHQRDRRVPVLWRDGDDRCRWCSPTCPATDASHRHARHGRERNTTGCLGVRRSGSPDTFRASQIHPPSATPGHPGRQREAERTVYECRVRQRVRDRHGSGSCRSTRPRKR
jgi:hypothetical protein